MSRTRWTWARLLGGAAILAVLVWRLGTGPFMDGVRRVDGRRLLGPDVVRAAAEAFTRLGARVLVRPSPWRLGADQAALAGEWLAGWVGAACEQRPELAAAAGPYARWRLAEAAAGRLEVTVHHDDLLALPG